MKLNELLCENGLHRIRGNQEIEKFLSEDNLETNKDYYSRFLHELRFTGIIFTKIVENKNNSYSHLL